MIEINNKKNCNGCCACVDICPLNAIKLETDEEGFWYPRVDKEKCIKCEKCIQVCPELNYEKINNKDNINPFCFVANNQDIEVRKDSTSGGIFSAFADYIYQNKGFVGGAAYEEDFSVKHILSDNSADLKRIRSSKYLQSNLEGFYKSVFEKLHEDKDVLVCGCPCQMAALRLFLGKDYKNLIICDFICRGINSPKVFRKHLDSLEDKFNSKIIYVKAKNKEYGWKSLTFKTIFSNSEKYFADGKKDNFTRGYLKTGYYCRPSCYECNFKNSPRLADITIGDFWGVEKVAPSLDDNLGTSLVMCNTQKGCEFFEGICNNLHYHKVTLDQISSGNLHLYESVITNFEKRRIFFDDIDKMTFPKLADKYFPSSQKRGLLYKSIQILKKFSRIINIMGFSPKVFYQFIWLNFLRKNTSSNFLKGNLLVPTPFSVFDIHKSAKIEVNGFVIFGFSKIKGSHLETRIRLEKKSILRFGGNFNIWAGADIQVFSNGILQFEGEGGGCNINCQIICADNILIGKRTLIGRNVTIRDYDAHYIMQDNYKVKAPIRIGNHCWIGENALISKGVTIGDGAIVASRSWVIKKVKPKSLVGGTPAIVLKKNIQWKI